MGRPAVPRAVLSDSDDVGVGRNRRPGESVVASRRGARTRQLRERTRIAPSGTKENRGPRTMSADLSRRSSTHDLPRRAKVEQPPRPPDDDDERKAPETPPDEPRPQPVQDPPEEVPDKGPYTVH